MLLTSSQENSERVLMEQVYMLADAGASVLQIRTKEPVRTALVLRKNILTSNDSEYREWDTVNGFRSFTRENYVDHKIMGNKDDFMAALETPLTEIRDIKSSINAHPNRIHYFVFVDPQPFIANNHYAAQLIQQYGAILSTSNVCILFVTPDTALESLPVGSVLTAAMNTPSAAELQEVLEKIVDRSVDDFEGGSEMTEDDAKKLSYLGLGLSLFEFETYAAIAIIEASTNSDAAITFERLSEGISKGKTEVVKQSDILELTASASMADVGGMARLKDWVASRADCYSDAAKEYGIEPPKGIVIVGVPGTGKSLCAKSTASELGVPLVSMDFGNVFSKYIGDSESRVRAALKMAEDMAPCVLFLDELDKGLGGAGGGSGDNGTSSRVLGTFLKWLQDCKAPVFVMVTANRVDGLPPELLRRGRFDQIFSVGLPNAVDRIEVLKIHLRKRNKPFDFTKDDLFAYTKASDNYVPAEIESAVKDAMIAAFNAKETLGMQHILQALEDMVPMSKSNKEQIERIVAWAKDNATSVNYDDELPQVMASAPVGRRMISRKPMR
jgi:AAA+ superfamily predicted ATPase